MFGTTARSVVLETRVVSSSLPHRYSVVPGMKPELVAVISIGPISVVPLAGRTEVNVSAGSRYSPITKVAGVLIRPLEKTVTCALPARARSAGVTTPCTRLGPSLLVERASPFQCTVASRRGR
jgi:hypothetical protein